MFIKRRAKASRGWTLVEMMVAIAVFSVAGLALSTIFIFSIRSFAALTNYAMLDWENRYAMDIITRELRQAQKVLNYTTNGSSSITILNGENKTVTYTFNASSKQML